jgi:diaminopropionate ammonia-lyase
MRQAQLSDNARLLELIWGSYFPTPLQDLPALAQLVGCARVWVKREDQRSLGNFKSLGGVVAGLRALADAVGLSIESFLEERVPGPQRPGRVSGLPRLICASDGNHGLAVATAAARAGTASTIYLPLHVDRARVRRIVEAGGVVETVIGTYDDAVDVAAAAAEAGRGLLIPDTTDRSEDPVVAEVMRGYGVLSEEIRAQISEAPTHLFVQAGVGGLAAALATGLRPTMASPGRICLVEPAGAACVAAGLAAGRVVRIHGDLATVAEMLSCGQASAPALAALIAHHAESVVVSDDILRSAVGELAACGGPASTPSGAAGIAGLLKASSSDEGRRRYGITSRSVILSIVTEGVVPA